MSLHFIVEGGIHATKINKNSFKFNRKFIVRDNVYKVVSALSKRRKEVSDKQSVKANGC